MTCIRGWIAVHVQIRMVRKQETMMSQVPRFEPWATQPTSVRSWLVVDGFREYKALLISRGEILGDGSRFLRLVE